MSLIDLLASEYIVKQAIHGLDDPRPCGFSIMRDLQEDLVQEQKKIASDIPLDFAIDDAHSFIYDTADLYTELIETDDVVSATQSDILIENTNIVDWASKCYREIYYTSRVIYNINIGALLAVRDVPEQEWPLIASSIALQPDHLKNYIESYGAQDLFDKWLPAEKTDIGYYFEWSLDFTSFKPDYWVEAVFTLRERHLSKELKTDA